MKTPNKIEQRIYPDNRYIAGASPHCIYIPCKEIMLKIMRACINVKESHQLWINKRNELNCTCGLGIHKIRKKRGMFKALVVINKEINEV